LLVTFILPVSVHATDKIRIGFPDLAVVFLPLPVAQKEGFLEKEGLQAEFVKINPTVALAALVSGEIDYYTAIAPAAAAAIRGLPVKIVACYVPGSPIALIARPEFKSVAELRGKTISLNTLGGDALEVTARLIFKHFGIDAGKELTFIANGPLESRLASMKGGLTAATLGSPPTDFLGRNMGFIVLARAHELFNYPTSGLVASAKKIKEKPDQVKRVIEAGIEADRYIHQNREGTIQAMMEWLKIDKQMATATYDGSLNAFNNDGTVPKDGIGLVIAEVKRLAKVNREISLDEVTDLRILGEAQKELGRKSK
jgi:ABC-type nitrate/sulfonate/bicarbonate transport system substrate-binding protein